jgi:hypothetical protein
METVFRLSITHRDGHKHMCFNGRPTTASAKTSFAYGQGLTADFAGRWSFFIQVGPTFVLCGPQLY